MYTVRVSTESMSKSIRFFNSQTAIKYALDYAKCVDVTSVDVMSEETGEIGLIILNGSVEWIGMIDF